MLQLVAPMASTVPMTKCMLLSVLFISSSLFTKIYSEHNERLELLISRIEKGVTFYERHAKDINLDGIFGLRVVEGKETLLAQLYNYFVHFAYAYSITE